MSVVKRVLNRTYKQITGQPLTYVDTFQNWLDHNSFVSSCRDWCYSIRAFLHNLPMFIRFAWGYRSWDYTYNIEIFINTLEDTARSLKKYGFSVDSDKTSRRAFTAAGLLRKAYLDRNMDKTLQSLYKKYGYKGFRKYDNSNERIVEGMREVANKRQDKTEKQLKEDAWKYVSKYIEYFWD